MNMMEIKHLAAGLRHLTITLAQRPTEAYPRFGRFRLSAQARPRLLIILLRVRLKLPEVERKREGEEAEGGLRRNEVQ